MPKKRKTAPVRTIPVIDLFAGPGGLGEGFSACASARNVRYGLALSVEMEENAHKTLLFRAFRRQFKRVPAGYWQVLRGELTCEELFKQYSKAHKRAEREARRITLSKSTAGTVRALVKAAIRDKKHWILVGGPPCQAYSLVGRARNRGRKDYAADKDHRHVLYREYLRLLADHKPPVFVMENVKGLLSAKYKNDGMFDRIRRDLENPTLAMSGERKRPAVSAHRAETKTEYRLIALAPTSRLNEPLKPADFIVRAEEFGIPQARHRVIIVGIRADLDVSHPRLKPLGKKSVRDAIGDLPRVRSGVSRSKATWQDLLAKLPDRAWMSEIDPDVNKRIRAAIEKLATEELGRGGEHVPGDNNLCKALQGWSNHSTRAHILPDLERYLFSSCFAAEIGRSPKLDDFPKALLPKHANVNRALKVGHFSDRFRVQLAAHPATTVTSHISKDGHYYIHYDPTQCRSLTVREAARLQTFPDDYFFRGPRTAQFHQVGNAVPPALAQQIAALLLPLFG